MKTMENMCQSTVDCLGCVKLLLLPVVGSYECPTYPGTIGNFVLSTNHETTSICSLILYVFVIYFLLLIT